MPEVMKYIPRASVEGEKVVMIEEVEVASIVVGSWQELRILRVPENVRAGSGETLIST